MNEPWEGIDVVLKDEGPYLKVIPITELGRRVADGKEIIAPEEKLRFVRRAKGLKAVVDEF